MLHIVADPLCPPLTGCLHLFPGPGIQEFQLLRLDRFLPRAGRFAKRSSGNPRGRRWRCRLDNLNVRFCC
jgi:hypothetical protein